MSNFRGMNILQIDDWKGISRFWFRSLVVYISMIQEYIREDIFFSKANCLAKFVKIKSHEKRLYGNNQSKARLLDPRVYANYLQGS